VAKLGEGEMKNHNFTDPSFLFFCVAFVFYALLVWLSISGSKASGDTFKRCSDLPEAAKQECVISHLERFKRLESAS
jgi:hypothetical protein